MADGMDDLTDRVQAVEQKLDQLSASVDERFNQVDERFNQVDERFNQVDERFKQVDHRFDMVDRRFDSLEKALVEQREYTEFGYARLEAAMHAGFGRLDRKLDQFIDVQLQTNQLVDRRLRALEG